MKEIPTGHGVCFLGGVVGHVIDACVQKKYGRLTIAQGTRTCVYNLPHDCMAASVRGVVPVKRISRSQSDNISHEFARVKEQMGYIYQQVHATPRNHSYPAAHHFRTSFLTTRLDK